MLGPFMTPNLLSVGRSCENMREMLAPRVSAIVTNAAPPPWPWPGA